MRSAWRNFIRNKVHICINLAGLTLALTVVMLIYLFVTDELSYDKWIDNYEEVVRIHPITTSPEGEKRWATSEGFVVPAIASSYPEVQSGARILLLDREFMFDLNGVQYPQKGIIAADSTILEVFPMQYVFGNKRSAMTNKGVVITESVATKVFGTIDPVGKSIKQADGDDLIVTAVVKDLPHASHFHFSVIIPLRQWWPEADQSRNMYAFYSYLRLKPGVDARSFNENIIRPWYEKFGYADNKELSQRATRVNLEATPVDEIHLHSKREKEFEANGSAQVVTVFVGAGILLLIIAVINYINLSNAIATRRSKEVAVRKTIGASRARLFGNFMAESFLFTSIAIIAALAATASLIPTFNSFIGKQTSLATFVQPSFVIALLIAWITVSFFSGVYPATVLSSYDPVTILRSGNGGVRSSALGAYLKHGLIGVQFTISAMMVVVAYVIADQVRFINGRDIGFDRSNVIVIQISGSDIVGPLKSEVSRIKGVASASAMSAIPGRRIPILSVRVPGIDEKNKEMRVISCDADVVKTLGLTMAAGRNFTDSPSDADGAFILNEAAVRELNLPDPVGQPFEYTFFDEKKGKVIGVVHDFNFASVHSKVEPVMLHIFPPTFTNFCVRIKPGTSPDVIPQIGSAWKGLTDAPFNWQFLDVSYDALYRTEQTTTKVVTWFMAISMLIAGLGLFGMITLFVQQRLREVGIRKVMGASRLSLMGRLSRDYLVVVVIGNCVAAYPSYLVISNWLEQFAFRVEPGITPFVASLAVSLVLTAISTGWIVFRTARMNPVSVLRYE